MKRLALLSFILAACGTSNNPPDAVQQQFFTQFAQVESLQAQAIQAQSSFAPIDGAIDYSGPCPQGGTVSVTGNYTGDGSSTNADFDQLMTFTTCAVDTDTLDGTWQWTGHVDAGGEELAITADFTATTPDQVAHIIYDVTMTVTNDGHFSIQGSITVGGTRYDAVDFTY